MATSSAESPTLYFGYGSNLWKNQMSLRCPHSTYLGLARLRDYHWIINERQYANVVEISNKSKSQGTNEEDVVWGLMYELHQDDEARLDRNEGVPYAYTKETMEMEFWAKGRKDGDSQEVQAIDVHKKPATKKALVYIDRLRTSGEFAPKAEYVHRMNMGIADALKEGVPKAYVDKVLRKWIPEENTEDDRETAAGGKAENMGVKALAEQQAREFVEEDER